MIKSSGSGIVTMAEDDLYYTGGTVIVDHGHGILTIYSQLETVLVSVGDKIKLIKKYNLKNLKKNFKFSKFDILNLIFIDCIIYIVIV